MTSSTKPRLPDLPVDGDTNLEFAFDQQAAWEAVEFFHRYLMHVRGVYAGRPFILEDWQYRITWELFGWKRADGRRRYRRAYIEVPRKNGKSTWGAGLALKMLLADGEQGAEIYGAAENREQASLIYDIATAMVMRNPALRFYQSGRLRGKIRCDVTPSTRTIHVRDTNSKYQALPADVAGVFGINAHGVIVDELHTQPNEKLVSALQTSQVNRAQPLSVFFTTAGIDVSKSFCGREHTRALKLIDGTQPDPHSYAVIYSADEKDDIAAEETLAKANPSWYGMDEHFRQNLRDDAVRAKEDPSLENDFKRLHLDIWTAQHTRFISLLSWDASAGYAVDEKSLEKVDGFGGLDLAQTTDMAALSLAFPKPDGTIDIVMRYWIPKERVAKRVRSAGVYYDRYVAEGLVKETPGDAIDMDVIYKDICELTSKFRIREIAFDPYQAEYLRQKLQMFGIRMIEMRQYMSNMTEPTKAVQQLVLQKRLHHGGHPVLRWNIDNLAVRHDVDGNLRPDKEKSTEKIDGAVAMIMAVGRAVVAERKQPTIWRIA